MILEFIKLMRSQIDDVTKYIFRVRGQVVEFSFISKNDGKHIIVAPSQTRCAMGCKFCQMTEIGGQVQNLTADEIVQCVSDVLFHQRRVPVKTLLVSFMGGGEPMLNGEALVGAMVELRERFGGSYNTIRFAVASLGAHSSRVAQFANLVKTNGLNCKFHLSLHSVFLTTRRELMPAACGPYQSVFLVEDYARVTGCQVELHYTPIEGYNDGAESATKLAEIATCWGWPVKLLDFKPHGGMTKSASYAEAFDRFRRLLEAEGATVETYSPPGADIGASCGQFRPEDYTL